MTATIADLVAQLRQVRETLAAAVVTARRAEADARQAGSHYREAATGTDHPKLKQAVADVEVAADKSAKVARLLSEAEERFAAYVARIAPEAAGQDVTTTATPTGEQLLTEATHRADAQQNADSFLSMMTRNAEGIQDTAKAAAGLAEDAINIVRNPIPPSPSVDPPVAEVKHPVIRPEPTPKVEATEAAGQLVVAALVAGLLAHKSYQMARRTIARLKRNDSETGTGRSDSSNGSS